MLMQKKGLDEPVEVSVQDGIHVTGFQIGPVILDHAIGVQDV
jgi:hypothetical protein